MIPRGLILCILLVVVALAACSDDPPDPPTPEPEPAAQQAQQPAATEPAVDPALLAPRWPRDSWRPLSQVAQANAELRPDIEREIEWCSESFANASAPPGSTLLVADEHEWIGRIAAATAEARGIALETMPAIWITSPEQVRAESCRQVTASSETPGAGRPGARWHWLVALGLIDADWGPAVLAHLLNVEQRGRYIHQPAVGTRQDASAVTLVVNPSIDPDAPSVLSHELIHYLQYQIIDTADLAQSYADTDRRTVLHWLLEADATQSALGPTNSDHNRAVELLREQGGGAYQPAAPQLYDRLPAELSEWFYGPYRRAAEFIELLQQDDAGVVADDLLRDLPDSTEQLLHFDKYESNEQPLDMSELTPLIDALPPGDEWQRLGSPLLVDGRDQDTLGELYLRLLISASTGRDIEAAAATAGWGGDRLHVFQEEGGPSTLALWAIAFDDADEHAEGMAGLREWLIAFSDGQARGLADEQVLGWDAPHNAIRVVDHLNTAWIIVGPAAAVDQTTANLLNQDEPFT